MHTQWIVKHIAEYGGDPDNIFLVGQSAGAQIGALAMIVEAERERQFKVRLSLSIQGWSWLEWLGVCFGGEESFC